MDIQLKDKMPGRFLAERAVEAPGGIVLMLDRFLGSGLDEEVFKIRGCSSQCVPLRHPAYQDVARAPIIFRIRPQDADLIGLALEAGLLEQNDHALEAANGLAVSGWLETDAPLDALARHLAGRMEQRSGGHGKAGLFRFADRRVLELAWEVFDATQKSILFGPIHSWHIIDRRGQLKSLNRPALENSPGRSQPALRISPQQLFELNQCQQIQEMLRGWQSIVKELPSDYLGQARSAINNAISIGAFENQDVLLLAAYTLQIHPRLASHPKVRALVRRSIEEQTPLMSVLAEIPDPDGWERIKSDLNGVGAPKHSFEAAIN